MKRKSKISRIWIADISGVESGFEQPHPISIVHSRTIVPENFRYYMFVQ